MITRSPKFLHQDGVFLHWQEKIAGSGQYRCVCAVRYGQQYKQDTAVHAVSNIYPCTVKPLCDKAGTHCCVCACAHGTAALCPGSVRTSPSFSDCGAMSQQHSSAVGTSGCLQRLRLCLCDIVCSCWPTGASVLLTSTTRPRALTSERGGMKSGHVSGTSIPQMVLCARKRVRTWCSRM